MHLRAVSDFMLITRSHTPFFGRRRRGKREGRAILNVIARQGFNFRGRLRGREGGGSCCSSVSVAAADGVMRLAHAKCIRPSRARTLVGVIRWPFRIQTLCRKTQPELMLKLSVYWHGFLKKRTDRHKLKQDILPFSIRIFSQTRQRV